MKLKNLRFAIPFLLCCFVFSYAAIDVTKRIKFARGKNSATVAGAVIRGERDTYLIGAKGGQNMVVVITSPEKNAVFQIQAPDGSFLPMADEGDDATRWAGELPAQEGDYKIIVGGTRGNASYKLTVTIR